MSDTKETTAVSPLEGISTLRIIVTDQEVHDIPIRSFEQLTVADYLRISEPRDNEPPHQTVARVFNIPTRITWVMKVHEVEALFEWYGKWMKEGAKAWGSVEAVQGLLKDAEEGGEPMKAAQALEVLKAHSLYRATIEVDGVKYIVPQHLDQDTVWGQWLSLQALAESHSGPEAELYPNVMAVLCLEEGERYPTANEGETQDAFDARYSEWMVRRRATFRKARFVDALACCTFFLSSSSRFAETMRPLMTSFHNWSKRPTGPTPPPTGGGTGQEP